MYVVVKLCHVGNDDKKKHVQRAQFFPKYFFGAQLVESTNSALSNSKGQLYTSVKYREIPGNEQPQFRAAFLSGEGVGRM
jgi:hypothetical protein